MISWTTPTPIDNFPLCKFSYGYLINGEFTGEVMGTSISLSDLNLDTPCDQTFITIYPVVRAQNMTLTNVNASGTTCNGESNNYKKNYNK